MGRLLAADAGLAEPGRRLRSLSRLVFFQGALGRVCVCTDNIVVGYFLGPAAVATLYLTQRLIQTVTAQLQGVGGATWAGLAVIPKREPRTVSPARGE